MIYYNGVRHKCDPNLSISQLYPKHGPTGGAGLGNYLFVWGSISEERQLNVKDSPQFETSPPKKISNMKVETQNGEETTRKLEIVDRNHFAERNWKCVNRGIESVNLRSFPCHGVGAGSCAYIALKGEGRGVFKGWWWDWIRWTDSILI